MFIHFCHVHHVTGWLFCFHVVCNFIPSMHFLFFICFLSVYDSSSPSFITRFLDEKFLVILGFTKCRNKTNDKSFIFMNRASKKKADGRQQHKKKLSLKGPAACQTSFSTFSFLFFFLLNNSRCKRRKSLRECLNNIKR